MTSINSNAREFTECSQLSDALQGEDCPAPEQFLTDAWSALDAATRMQFQTHIASCAACQVERRLARLFDEDSATSAQVQALAQRVQMPGDMTPAARPSSATPWRGLLAATVAACAIGLGATALRDNDALPQLPARDDATQTMRGALIHLLPQAAASSLQASMIQWTAVDGGPLYRVSVRNAADDVVWTGETQRTRIALPTELAQTGGRLRFEVVAYNEQGERVAQSAEGVYISGRGGEP